MSVLTDKTCKSTIYITPDRLLEPIRRYFGGKIKLDPATEPNNPTKANRFYTEETNGLDKDWEDGTFVNPPYGKALKFWTEKIHEEARHPKENLIVALLPGQRFETQYWQDNVLNPYLDFCVLIRKRINFFRPDGELAKGNPYGSMLYIYNAIECSISKAESEVNRCFGELGKIWVARFL